MCFTIHPNHTDALIAEEDIPCIKSYRIINKESGLLASLYYNHLVHIGETYVLGDCLEVISGEINEGFHSFDTGLCASEHVLHNLGDLILVRCIIPKGTVYYQNSYCHEYVSESIKLVSVIDTSKYKDRKFKASSIMVNITDL